MGGQHPAHVAFATVHRIAKVEPHPNPDVLRLEVVTLKSGVVLVTGKHYRAGDLGVFIRAGCMIPGWLAASMWHGNKQSWFTVSEREYFGVKSAGLLAGAVWRVDADSEFEPWDRWEERWKEGHTLDGYLGVVPAPANEHTVKTLADAGKSHAFPGLTYPAFAGSSGPDPRPSFATGGVVPGFPFAANATAGGVPIVRDDPTLTSTTMLPTFTPKPFTEEHDAVFGDFKRDPILPRDLDETPEQTVPRD